MTQVLSHVSGAQPDTYSVPERISHIASTHRSGLSSHEIGKGILGSKVHIHFAMWGFPQMGDPQMDGLFHGRSHLEVDDLGVALFQETPMLRS